MSVQVCNDTEIPSAAAELERVLRTLPQDRVSIGWLHRELRGHSFELLAFVLALVGVLPGASAAIGCIMVIPALGMIFSSGVRLPRVVALRSIPARQASFVLGRTIPLLRAWETGVLVPLPLTNVLPALTIAGLSLAVCEGSAALLFFSCCAAMGSLAVTGMTLLAATHAFVRAFS